MIESLSRFIARIWVRSKIVSLLILAALIALFIFSWQIFVGLAGVVLVLAVLYELNRHKSAILLLLVIGLVVVGFTGLPLGGSTYTDDGVLVYEGRYFALFNPKRIARRAVRSHQNVEALEVEVISLLSSNLVAYGADNYALIGQLFKLGSIISNGEREQIGTFTVVFGWQ